MVIIYCIIFYNNNIYIHTRILWITVSTITAAVSEEYLSNDPSLRPETVAGAQPRGKAVKSLNGFSSGNFSHIDRLFTVYIYICTP